MEFFRFIEINTEESVIQDEFTLKNFKLLSNQIFILESFDDAKAKIDGLWGEFTLTRQSIKGGLRYSLVECPNALTWTITTGFVPNPDTIVLHLTINRINHSKSFIDEINSFLDDQIVCLKEFKF
jgi:hypothetical protein